MEIDNTIFAIQKALKELKLKVSNKTIKDYLLGHPEYPTIKSVCDGLSRWKIEHYPLRLELNEIEELEIPFIAHSNNSGGLLMFVQQIRNSKVEYYDVNNKKRKESFKDFSQRLSGAVIVIEPEQKIKDSNYLKERQEELIDRGLLPILIASLVCVAAYMFTSVAGKSVYSGNYQLWLLLATKSLGIVASLFLVLHEMKVHTKLSDRLCGFNSKTDCDSVLKSTASRMFGWINWADIGIIYFSGTLIFLLGAQPINSLTTMASISVLTLPYSVYSIYYQAFKVKKYCPFCLVVQLLLIVEFVILLPDLIVAVFSVAEFVRFVVSMVMPAIGWILYKGYHDHKNALEIEHDANIRFKGNADIFEYLLTSEGKQEIEVTNQSLVLGNSKAPVTISAFLSLYCNPCATAFKELYTLLRSCMDVKMNAIFTVYNDKESQEVIDHIYMLYQENDGATKVLEFLEKWYSADVVGKKKLMSSVNVPERFHIASELKLVNGELFKNNKIEGTPTVFVNGYKLPQQYQYSDIDRYVGILKRQSIRRVVL
ncbi:hypothetical protein EYV94_27895 [Puteibacter caeruleilacunae]|nr:hypothetical protein EYV94_27895 [Puteibacter caeruleilacunae]